MSTNSTKTVKGRISNKHGAEADWYAAGTAANPFIPLPGELIIYDPDAVYTETRTKHGDGSTPVHLLPWANGCNESVGLEFELISDNKEYSVKSIGVCADTDVVIPKGYCGKPVTYIGYGAFQNNISLKSVIMPDTITGTHYEVFSGCTSLTMVRLSRALTTISTATFSACKALIDIEIPSSITAIEPGAFYECDFLTNIVIPKSVKYIAMYCFQICPNLTICCEVESKPTSWSSDWNPDNRPVVWGFANDFIAVNDKINYYQLRTDETLETDSKEVVGAINELKQQFDDGGADGNDGREIELLKGTTHIQWRYVGDDTWTNLVALADLKGANGKEVQLQKTTTHIQWRLTDGSWADLVALSDLKGTSVTITNVSQNNSAGGTSTITFSDGKTLNIKNGADGKTPVKGTDYFTSTEIDDITTEAAAKVDIDVFVKSGTGAKKGLVPAPPTTAGTEKYLREDGNWVTPTNSTYSAGTGLALASDKKTFNHSNSVDAVETAGLYKIKYDAQGHITGTESFSLPTKNSWNYDDKYLAKVTYEWNNQIICGSGDSGAVSFGRYNVYDTQITFDIVSTTTKAISGKLVIATQNGVIMQAVVYGDASGQLASRLRIYQSVISGSRSWIEVFGMFDGWSKNKAHIYAIGLNSGTVQKQYTKVTQTGSAVKEPVEITSGDTKWTGTITDAIQSQIPSATKQANWDTAYGWGNHASAGYTKNDGTVTSIIAGTGLSGGTITTSGTISLANATARTVADTGTHHLTYRDGGAGAMGYDSSIFIGGVLGELNATTFRVNQKSTIEYVTDYDALVFNFS